MRINKYLSTVCVGLLSTLLISCGGGVCNTSSPPSGTLSLAIAAPSQYPAGLPNPIIVPITMMNTSGVDANQ